MVDHLTGGGQERVAAQLAAALRSRTARSSLLATRGGGDYERMLEGVDLNIGRRRSRFDVRGWLPQLLWLIGRRFDVVHTHNPGSLAAAVRLRRARVLRSRIVAHVQMLPPHGTEYRAATERWHKAFRHDVDAWIVTNERLASYLVERCGCPSRAVRIVPNPVEFAAWESPVRHSSRRPGVLMTAQWRAQKDHETAIHAAALLRDAGIDATWSFAGEPDPQLVARARDLVASLGLEGVVEILGRRTDVRHLAAESDVGVLATHFEGSPLAVVEYAAAGLPAVVSVVEGTEQLIAPDHGIIGVPPQDPRALADAVASLLRDPERARTLGARARERMRALCDVEVVLDAICDVYDDVLSAPRSRRAEIG
jgi:glycosyltransferase involved in cell wall biosynthesis